MRVGYAKQGHSRDAHSSYSPPRVITRNVSFYTFTALAHKPIKTICFTCLGSQRNSSFQNLSYSLFPN